MCSDKVQVRFDKEGNPHLEEDLLAEMEEWKAELERRMKELSRLRRDGGR